MWNTDFATVSAKETAAILAPMVIDHSGTYYNKKNYLKNIVSTWFSPQCQCTTEWTQWKKVIRTIVYHRSKKTLVFHIAKKK